MSGAHESNAARVEGGSQTATKESMEEKGFLRTNPERKRRGNGSSLKDKCDYRKVLFIFFKNEKDEHICW